MTTPSRLSLCVNLGNESASQFSNYNFNSFAKIRGRIFGASEDGIFSLDDSDRDNGVLIQARVKSRKINFGDMYQKWFNHAWLTCRAKGDLNLNVFFEENREIRSYPIENPHDLNWHTALLSIDKIRSNFFSFSVDNLGSGCDFSIKSLFVQGPAKKPIMVFAATTGLNNVLDPALIPFDPKDGRQDVAEIVNMWVDDAHYAKRREGFTLRTAGYFHSLQSDGENAYVIYETGTQGILQRVNHDGTIEAGVVSALAPYAPMSGDFLAGQFFWGNGQQKGIATGTSWVPWIMTPPTIGEIVAQEQFYSAPLVAGPIWFHSGRIYLADRKAVFFSEHAARGGYSRFRMGNYGFMQFETPVLMGFSVNDGMYIGDSESIYFIEGDPGTKDVPKQIKVANYPAIAGTNSYSTLKSGTQFLGSSQKYEAVIATTNGICTAGSGGSFKNLTEEKLIYPYAQSGAGIVIDEEGMAGRPRRYIVTLNP
jgi:hypothetical protein